MPDTEFNFRPEYSILAEHPSGQRLSDRISRQIPDIRLQKYRILQARFRKGRISGQFTICMINCMSKKSCLFLKRASCYRKGYQDLFDIQYTLKLNDFPTERWSVAVVGIIVRYPSRTLGSFPQNPFRGCITPFCLEFGSALRRIGSESNLSNTHIWIRPDGSTYRYRIYNIQSVCLFFSRYLSIITVQNRKI